MWEIQCRCAAASLECCCGLQFSQLVWLPLNSPSPCCLICRFVFIANPGSSVIFRVCVSLGTNRMPACNTCCGSPRTSGSARFIHMLYFGLEIFPPISPGRSHMDYLPYKPIFALVDDHNLACMLLTCTAVIIKTHGMLTMIIRSSHSVLFAFTSLHLCIVIIYNSTMRCQSGTFQEFVLAPVTSEI